MHEMIDYGQYVYTVSKNCANLFLSELRQINTNFDNIWQKDGKELKLYEMRSFSTSHSLHSFSRHGVVLFNTKLRVVYIYRFFVESFYARLKSHPVRHHLWASTTW